MNSDTPGSQKCQLRSCCCWRRLGTGLGCLSPGALLGVELGALCPQEPWGIFAHGA